MPTRPAKLRDCCLLTRVWTPTAGTPRDLNEIAGTEAPQRAPAPALDRKVKGSNDQTAADPSLLRIVARAHKYTGTPQSKYRADVHDVAREEHVTAAFIYTLLRLPWLVPDITTAIVNGRQPQQLNAKTLTRKASRLPTAWAEHRSDRVSAEVSRSGRHARSSKFSTGWPRSRSGRNVPPRAAGRAATS